MKILQCDGCGKTDWTSLVTHGPKKGDFEGNYCAACFDSIPWIRQSKGQPAMRNGGVRLDESSPSQETAIRHMEDD